MEEQREIATFDHYEVPVHSVGKGKPTLLLHGFDGALDGPFLAGLADGRRVVAPTHPGFDGTTSHPDIQTIHNVVVFYLELLDSLDLYHVDIIGHSLGAMFAAEIAAIVPSRVRRLVLADPLGLWTDDAQIPDVLATGGSPLNRMLWADSASEAAVQNQPVPFDRTCNWAAATNYMWPIPDRGLAANVHRVMSPTLLVRGSADGVVSEAYLSAFAAMLPNATSAEIANAGHFPMLEQPDEFVRTVSTFLDS